MFQGATSWTDTNSVIQRSLPAFELAVLSGRIVWPIEQAREVLDSYADWYATLSDDLFVSPSMATTPEAKVWWP